MELHHRIALFVLEHGQLYVSASASASSLASCKIAYPKLPTIDLPENLALDQIYGSYSEVRRDPAHSAINPNRGYAESTMAQVLNLNPLPLASSYSTRPQLHVFQSLNAARNLNVDRNWSSLLQSLKCNGRFTCLFSDNRRQYLIIAKGEVMLAVIFNPLLYALRGTRNGLTYLTTKLLGKRYADGPTEPYNMSTKEAYGLVSAKERILKKWGSE
ncbi:hypothetical protein COLO4_31887 [Corchorus olitorius]|uniref:Uncharacterized protein n=1 Tax=Corchorus olitorius TaxID=93759 RepID=A0A1R3H2X5_9ROSI|nr:hypothetical protein COLO4_31887 [Corchorus olitorius]